MKPKIVIIGESCVDEYVYGTCDRVCPEAAALCFHHDNTKTTNPGMAGNTYENLKALNKDNYFIIELITSNSSIIKRRFIDTKYNSIIFREDINDKCDPIDLSKINFINYDCIIISDYNKGFLSISDICSIKQSKKENCPIFIDTKKELKNLINCVDFIKINSTEFKQNIEDIEKIKKQTTLIVTEGENGATLYSNNITKHFDTEKIILRDVCGAGDTFLAALVANYMKTHDINQSIIFANSCACKVVSKFGVVTI